MPVIRLCFLWHMHQPFYKDLATGEYRLPWVRLHALKDYYGMVKLLDEFTAVRQNFNLVPSLVLQIEDYASGAARDPFYDVVAKPASDLTEAERLFALEYLFQSNETQMIRRYPRFADLLEQQRSAARDLPKLAARWSTQDFTDLQVLSQLAWFDEFWIDGDRDVAELASKGRAFTPDDQRLMLTKQHEILNRVLPAYQDAASHSRIELSVTPYYHPILPLICDTNAGKTSAPEIRLPKKRFSHPDDARLQMKRALDFAEERFGRRPAGMWPSEGSVSNEVLEIAGSLGVRWMATDEGVLGRSINSYFGRDARGALDPRAASDLYRPYVFESSDHEVSLVFRDHSLSDLIGFVYSGMHAQDAATHFMQQLHASADSVLASGRDALVTVILDGENAWEHFPKSGREFLRRLYHCFEQDPAVQATTISDAIAVTSPEHTGHLRSLIPGSWINSNFNVWIGAPEDNRSWDLLADARDFYDRHAASATPDARALALEELLIAEGSDWNWWYGPEHHTANDADFDDLYRTHLANVYRALGAEPPQELSFPISEGLAAPNFTPQTQYIRPKLSGKTASYFDWLGAAVLTASSQGAMHTTIRRLAAVHAGFDERFLFARLDFAGAAPKSGECVLHVHATDPQSGVATLTEIHVLIDQSSVKRWWLSRGDGEGKPLTPSDFEEGAARLTSVLEVRVQRSALRAVPGGNLNLRFTCSDDHVTETIPREGWMKLAVFSEEELVESANKHW